MRNGLFSRRENNHLRSLGHRRNRYPGGRFFAGLSRLAAAALRQYGCMLKAPINGESDVRRPARRMLNLSGTGLARLVARLATGVAPGRFATTWRSPAGRLGVAGARFLGGLLVSWLFLAAGFFGGRRTHRLTGMLAWLVIDQLEVDLALVGNHRRYLHRYTITKAIAIAGGLALQLL